ncbi:MAG: hypothetical protein HFG70_00375 [Hungatella sp.]|nr:hypothetical protein [Hungatella sp.]
MSNLKTAGTAVEPETLMRGMTSTIMEQREKIREEQREEEQEKPKDTAELSETLRWFSSDGTISADEAPDWKPLLEWQPDPNLDVPTQLQQLSKLYLTLLEAVLKYTEGEHLEEQLARLDALVAQKLNLLLEQNLKQLTSLLEEAGQTDALDDIRSSLYRQTAGKSLSPRAAHSLFAPRGASGKGVPLPGRLDRTGRPEDHALRGAPKGMIYQSSGKQNTRFQHLYDTQQTSWKEQIRQRNAVIINARKGISENTFKQGACTSLSGRELERANGFAAHMRGSGNLFKNPGINARNEEVTGLLAAVMSIKGQVYVKEQSPGSSITLPLQNAIEKIIHQYIGRKDASTVYYHTLSAYRQMQNPQKAIEEGQNYAYRQFREKQKDPLCQKSPQYSKDSGFFRAMSKGLNPEKEFAVGVNILQKDWQNFLCAVGSRQSSYLSRIGIHSPWGLLADTRMVWSDRDWSMGKILLGTALIMIVGSLAVLLFRLI